MSKRCKHCNIRLEEEIVLALMALCGAERSVEPCPITHDGEHEWVKYNDNIPSTGGDAME